MAHVAPRNVHFLAPLDELLGKNAASTLILMISPAMQLDLSFTDAGAERAFRLRNLQLLRPWERTLEVLRVSVGVMMLARLAFGGRLSSVATPASLYCFASLAPLLVLGRDALGCAVYAA